MKYEKLRSRRHSTSLLSLLLVLAVFQAACQEKEEPTPKLSPAEKSAPPQEPVEGSSFAVVFERQPGSVSGIMSGLTCCNDYNAIFTVNINEIKINQLYMTNNEECPRGTGNFVVERQYYLMQWILANTIPGISITLQVINSLIDGFGGCNTYNALLVIEDPNTGSYRLGPINSTSASCSAEINTQEHNYFAFFRCNDDGKCKRQPANPIGTGWSNPTLHWPAFGHPLPAVD